MTGSQRDKPRILWMDELRHGFTTHPSSWFDITREGGTSLCKPTPPIIGGENRSLKGRSNRMEQEELAPESSRGEDDQESCINDFHTFPLSENNFEGQVTRVEEQENPFNNLSWHRTLQTLLEVMDGKDKEEVEEEEVSIEEEKSQGKGKFLKEGREVEVEDA
ncbi:unnamed protein product [Linum trigynum]|uniref:Uncharacterized protein n=1 Tax=Linum trigynum TaxID=586398 RepID=A0AAV2DDR3_9ROSI